MILERIFDIIVELERQKTEQPIDEGVEVYEAWCV